LQHKERAELRTTATYGQVEEQKNKAIGIEEYAALGGTGLEK
jgi:hypothetical protein